MQLFIFKSYFLCTNLTRKQLGAYTWKLDTYVDEKVTQNVFNFSVGYLCPQLPFMFCKTRERSGLIFFTNEVN